MTESVKKNMSINNKSWPVKVHQRLSLCACVPQIAECCKGFYGPDCKPCIGGFQHPCYDRGAVSQKQPRTLYWFRVYWCAGHLQCLDGIQGNGSCSCQPGFKGIACHICEDPNKHGDNCDEGNDWGWESRPLASKWHPLKPADLCQPIKNPVEASIVIYWSHRNSGEHSDKKTLF